MNAVLIESTTVKRIERRGRPLSSDKLIFKTIGLTKSQWEWLSLWNGGGNKTVHIRELFERAMKFWPKGPYKFR